jgi:hypothetical protein
VCREPIRFSEKTLTAAAIDSFVTSNLPKKVQHINAPWALRTAKNDGTILASFFQTQAELPHCVVINNKVSLSPLMQALAARFDGKLVFGHLPVSSMSSIPAAERKTLGLTDHSQLPVLVIRGVEGRGAQVVSDLVCRFPYSWHDPIALLISNSPFCVFSRTKSSFSIS